MDEICDELTRSVKAAQKGSAWRRKAIQNIQLAMQDVEEQESRHGGMNRRS